MTSPALHRRPFFWAVDEPKGVDAESYHAVALRQLRDPTTLFHSKIFAALHKMRYNTSVFQ